MGSKDAFVGETTETSHVSQRRNHENAWEPATALQPHLWPRPPSFREATRGSSEPDQGAAPPLPVFGFEEPNQVSVLDKSPRWRKH